MLRVTIGVDFKMFVDMHRFKMFVDMRRCNIRVWDTADAVDAQRTIGSTTKCTFQCD